ncbi:MAG: bifunctional 5,6,7,8-tetrahydromethanopterin hydro-lyase/3-hexulose-6-phosphate synthase [Candidatus Bathyarchaeota archaeon]|nr:bifunctional 5,6,7,8-tetrahydromethanopterin hydro-lyase/3-hexulose-6-phosphate synthase [Candidatus Bathyarchaeum tardum]WGM88963.1 MAG: bifunctional 5,6,7,8-tetrahydromethanopterin hydro-lyase/3-hexulose-6-phosphate synthase [Candidatus Bathyarchaeum tardum]
MSGYDGKKPETQEEFIKLLAEAKKEERKNRRKSGSRSTKPTIKGTADIMGIHRDTLYQWMREFDVDFSDVNERELLFDKITTNTEPAYLIGEALMGEGTEIAHVDLLIGDKTGPVGTAFANGLSNLSAGHTPLLAVIRPNLPPKPHTLLVPKVTVKNMTDAGKIFGPAQAAVAKAVADSVEEGVIPEDKVDEWVIVCSVFIHPQAKDFRSIYHYNYSATKLAIQRAMDNYPSLEKVMYDKDRAKHPIMGFNVPRLWRPPYLQIALDVASTERAKQIISQLPESDRIILEVGTPLLKKEGIGVVRKLREVAKDMFIVADLKTLDVGQVEVDMSFEETADAVVVAGLATTETIDKFIAEAKRLGIYAIMDLMNVTNPIEKLQSLKRLPDVAILHRAIDAEKTGKTRWDIIKEMRETFKGKKFLVAVAGGITPETAPEALANGADIIIVGRYITQSKDVERATREFLKSTKEMTHDIDLFRVHVE